MTILSCKDFYKDVDIIFVSNYYDHPLAGDCIYQGKTHKFEWEYQDDNIYLEKLNTFQRIKHWYSRTLFGLCVGWHYHYKRNKKPSYFHYRKPEWLYKMLFNLYYYGKFTSKYKGK
jgi:hypothetical protein